jgi:hypothetical protein
MPVETDIAMLELQEEDFTLLETGGARVRVRLNKRPGAEWFELLKRQIRVLADAKPVLLEHARVAVESGELDAFIAFDASEPTAEVIHDRLKDAILFANWAAAAKNHEEEERRLVAGGMDSGASSFARIVGKLKGKK